MSGKKSCALGAPPGMKRSSRAKSFTLSDNPPLFIAADKPGLTDFLCPSFGVTKRRTQARS